MLFSTVGVMFTPLSVAILLLVIAVSEGMSLSGEKASEECVLSFVIPKSKIKSTCSNVDNISKQVAKNKEQMWAYDKQMTGLKSMLVKEQERNYNERTLQNKRVHRLERIINQLIGYKPLRPTEERTMHKQGRDTTSQPYFYGKLSQNSPRIRDETLADVPQLETMVQKYTLNALRKVNNTISQEVDKHLKEYENNFKEDLRRSLQQDSSSREDTVPRVDDGIRAEQPMSVIPKNHNNRISGVLSNQLNLLRKSIRDLKVKYEEVQKDYYSLEERMRSEMEGIQQEISTTKVSDIEVHRKVQNVEKLLNETGSTVRILNREVQGLNNWKFEMINSVHRANISTIKNINKMSTQINSSLYQYITDIMGPLDDKVQEIAKGSDMLELLIFDLKHDLNSTQEKHDGSIDMVQSKIQRIDDGMKLQFLNISQILFNAISVLKGTDNQTVEKLQKYNESINIMKGNLLGKIQHVNLTMQLLKSHTKNQSEEMQKQANVIKHLNKILNSTSLRMNAMKKELLEFRTEVLVSSGEWAPYNFSTHANITSKCFGRRYIRKSGYRVGQYVGVILCSVPGRYKILLSDDMLSGYLDIADNRGSGDDHCEFVGSTKKSFHCTGYSTRKTAAFGRNYWGEEPKRQFVAFLSPTCSWYDCSVIIP